MDPTCFDTLTRRIRVATTRRSLLGGLAGAVAIVLGVAPTEVAARPRRRNRLGAQGPCGNGGGKANRCERDRDCCTGVCEPVRQAKHGRCRCRQRGQACTEDRNCCRRRGQGMVCLDQTCQVLTCGTGGPCAVFVTSGRYAGNFGGLEQADNICQALADAPGSQAPAGTYQAWLSDSTTSAGERLAHSTEPYILVDGTEVAANWDALADAVGQYLQNAINLSERGQLVSDLVWTNTNGSGGQFSALPTTSCVDWTSITPNRDEAEGRGGLSSRVNVAWTDTGGFTCVSSNHFYCLQQP